MKATLTKHRAWIVVGAGVFCLPWVIRNAFLVNILALTYYWIALSVAWNILGGMAGQFSLGHSIFLGAGSYGVGIALVQLHRSVWLGLVGGMAAAAVLGMVIAATCFRLRGPIFTLATIAAAEVTRILTLYFHHFTGGASGLSIPFAPGFRKLMFSSTSGYATLALALAAVSVIVSGVIERSRWGAYFAAIREDERAAEAAGVPTLRYKLLAMLTSAVLTALAGSFYALYILFIEPNNEFALMSSVMISLGPIVGGLGSTAGAVVGGIAIAWLQQAVQAFLGGARQGVDFALFGILLLLVVLVWPQGILRHRRSRGAKRQGRRHGREEHVATG